MEPIPAWFHLLVTPLAMLLVFALNARVSFRRADLRSIVEAERLQTVLLEELKALALLYRANIELLDRGEHTLLSPRAPMAVYRAHLGRLSTIDTGLVRNLIHIHIRNEHIEMLMSARAKTARGGSVTVYLFENKEPMDPQFRVLLETNLEELTACLRSYEPNWELSRDGAFKYSNHSSQLSGIARAIP